MRNISTHWHQHTYTYLSEVHKKVVRVAVVHYGGGEHTHVPPNQPQQGLRPVRPEYICLPLRVSCTHTHKCIYMRMIIHALTHSTQAVTCINTYVYIYICVCVCVATYTCLLSGQEEGPERVVVKQCVLRVEWGKHPRTHTHWLSVPEHAFLAARLEISKSPLTIRCVCMCGWMLGKNTQKMHG
jgi:hypothetical protein